jgi:hypothetical protein
MSGINDGEGLNAPVDEEDELIVTTASGKGGAEGEHQSF